MQSKATTVAEYLAGLPEDRRTAIAAVRKIILKNLDKGYQEGMQYGMIGYCVPHSVYPAGYHCNPKQPLPFAALGSQKNHMSLHLLCIYGMPEHRAWFEEAWSKTGKKLDMGKGCVRFKKLEDVPLEVIGEAIRRVPASAFIEHYEATIAGLGKGPAAKKVVKKPVEKSAKTAGATARTSSKSRAGGATKGKVSRKPDSRGGR